MLCFLSSLEGVLLGLLILVGWIAMRQWGRIDDLKKKAKGLKPADRHPQDRLHRRRVAAPHPAPEATPEPVTPPTVEGVINPLDWLNEPVKPAPEPVADGRAVAYRADTDGNLKGFGPPTPLPAANVGRLCRFVDRYAPHIKLFLFALSVVGVWYALAWYYDYLNHYTPTEGDEIGDFRILYLKKFVGALLPMISSVGSALGLLFMLNPRYYIYLNGWLLTDYDFYTDLRHLDKPECFRRVLIFSALFGLFLLVSLWVLLHSSPQELTL